MTLYFQIGIVSLFRPRCHFFLASPLSHGTGTAVAARSRAANQREKLKMTREPPPASGIRGAGPGRPAEVAHAQPHGPRPFEIWAHLCPSNPCAAFSGLPSFLARIPAYLDPIDPQWFSLTDSQWYSLSMFSSSQNLALSKSIFCGLFRKE